MNGLVLLAGCGLGDGSCIEEVILTYLALEQHHWHYQPVALSRWVPSIDHCSEASGPLRNVLVESARMGRGRILSLESIDPKDFDCLLIPGGMGLRANYADQPAVHTLLHAFLDAGKPIATMCAGLDFLRLILGPELLQNEQASALPTSFCHDSLRNLYYTPAFRCPADLPQVQQGIASMIAAIGADRKKDDK